MHLTEGPDCAGDVPSNRCKRILKSEIVMLSDAASVGADWFCPITKCAVLSAVGELH